jgi:polyphenol oxidase
MNLPNVHFSPTDPHGTRVERIVRKGTRGEICVAYTNAHDGSFDLASIDVHARRLSFTGLNAVSWIRQEHGIGIAQVTTPSQAPLAGQLADAAITNQTNHAVSVITADCAPIALWTKSGAVGVVHAGWKGLEAGIIERTIEALRLLTGESEVFAWLGPCIGPECYEFGEHELDRVASRYGPAVRSVTSKGSASLDLASGVRLAVERVGANWDGSAEACTSCDSQWFSWRARKSPGRQAIFVWCEQSENSSDGTRG